jgi:hypothetical protein
MQIPSTRVHRRAPAALALAALLAVAAPTLRASTPKFFQAATQSEFLMGDVENLSIDSHGRLVLGPATELIYETPAPFLWTLVAGPDGALFVGTGNEGKVFRIGPDGKSSLFFDSAELEVHAIAPAPDGGLYVATSPDGKIYRVDRNGSASTFFDPAEKYIWALALDTKGNVYAGTGEKGIVYRITPDGKGTAFYRASATHVMSLAFDKAGNLIAGTGSPGRVLRIDPSGKPFVLLDSPFQEVHAVRVNAAGVIYATALNAQPSSGGGPVVSTETAEPVRSGSGPARAPVPSVSAEITSVAVVDVSPAATPASVRENRGSPRGAVYRITSDGVWDELWESRDDSPYDLAFDPDGAVIVGTGNKGKIFRLDGDPVEATLLARAGGQQVTSMLSGPQGRLYYATANPGKVFRLAAQRALRGTYESDSQDAGILATWGALTWHGTTPAGSGIELFTRSGNTETPDDTWSAWSAAYTNAEHSEIASPKARYLQWRAVLTGKQDATPVLTSVTAAYLQRNLRPRVTSITVHPPGIVFQKPYTAGEPDLAGFDNQTTPERRLQAAAVAAQTAAAALGRRTYEKGLQTLAWKAEDENGDDLVYEVQFRREGETTWTTLERGITDTILVWDTTTVPNGTYFARVVASDSPSNPPATALSGELESSAFDIDNTPPVIKGAAVKMENGRTRVSFTVEDADSPIQRVEYSVDGQRWRAVFPVDGIADSKTERYDVVLDGLIPERGLILRASDSMNNVITTQVNR